MFRLSQVPIYLGQRYLRSFDVFINVVLSYLVEFQRIFYSLVGLLQRVYVLVNQILHASNIFSEKIKLLEFIF